MMAAVVLRPEARDDLNAAYRWYEERRKGLGEEYLAAVQAIARKTLRQEIA